MSALVCVAVAWAVGSVAFLLGYIVRGAFR
jgi:hypothetical protein